MVRLWLLFVVILVLVPASHLAGSQAGGGPPAADQIPCLTACACGRGYPELKQEPKQVTVTVLTPDGKPTTIQVTSPDGAPEKPAIGAWAKLWDVGQTIVIGFVDPNPNPALVRRVKQHAQKWEEAVNLRFFFVPPGENPAKYGFKELHVGVSFLQRGHYSHVGTDSPQAVRAHGHSMNLGIDPRTPESVVRRVVLHEFGHALGFLHEHQHPQGAVKWKQPAALNYYRKLTGWDDETIQRNVFQPIDKATVVGAAFDRHSIMLYPIPPDLTVDGFSAGWNNTLSRTDTLTASALYPLFHDKVTNSFIKITPSAAPEKGVMIASVQKNSLYRSPNLAKVGAKGPYGLESGDIITRVNGKPVLDLREYKHAVENLNGRFLITVRDVRGIVGTADYQVRKW